MDVPIRDESIRLGQFLKLAGLVEDGAEARIANPAAARQLGIAMVFQHFSLFDTLTVTENIALGLPPDTKLDTLATRITETAGVLTGSRVSPGRAASPSAVTSAAVRAWYSTSRAACRSTVMRRSASSAFGSA